MNIVSGRTGTPHVTSHEFRQILEGTIGQGSYILQSGDNLAAELVTNNLLKIKSGMMSHHGNVSSVDAYDEVEIANGSQGMKRIDLIVNRYIRNDETRVETNQWVCIAGIPDSTSPVAPSYNVGNLQDGDLIDDCPVFQITLEGINVTEVKSLLSVAPNIDDLEQSNAELNSKLNDDRIGFPDYAKTIGTYNNTGFTAPENCWAKIESTSGWTSTTLNVNGNGVIIQQIKNTDSYPIRTSVMIPLKKGDVVTMSSSTSVNGITAVLYPMR